MEENSISKAQLLFNSVKEIERAVRVLEDFADVVRGECRPSEQTKAVKEPSAVALANVLVDAHTAIADLRKSLI